MQRCVAIFVWDIDDDFGGGTQEIAQLGVSHGTSIMQGCLSFVVLGVHFSIEVKESLNDVVIA